MNMAGFALSFALDLPVSPAIIVTGALIVFITRIITLLKERRYAKL